VSLRCGTNDSQRRPEDYEELLAEFRQEIARIRTTQNISAEHLWNMDQTMVRFDMPNRRTNNDIGHSQIRIANSGGSKRGFTVALCASAAGGKLPAVVIFKERSGCVPLRALSMMTIPDNVIVRATPNGWMTTSEVHYWVENVWNSSLERRRIIFLDQYRPHHTQDTRARFAQQNTSIVAIPGGTFLNNM
jgi:DDE superfamily endonuclease